MSACLAALLVNVVRPCLAGLLPYQKEWPTASIQKWHRSCGPLFVGGAAGFGAFIKPLHRLLAIHSGRHLRGQDAPLTVCCPRVFLEHDWSLTPLLHPFSLPPYTSHSRRG